MSTCIDCKVAYGQARGFGGTRICDACWMARCRLGGPPPHTGCDERVATLTRERDGARAKIAELEAQIDALRDLLAREVKAGNRGTT